MRLPKFSRCGQSQSAIDCVSREKAARQRSMKSRQSASSMRVHGARRQIPACRRGLSSGPRPAHRRPVGQCDQATRAVAILKHRDQPVFGQAVERPGEVDMFRDVRQPWHKLESGEGHGRHGAAPGPRPASAGPSGRAPPRPDAHGRPRCGQARSAVRDRRALLYRTCTKTRLEPGGDGPVLTCARLRKSLFGDGAGGRTTSVSPSGRRTTKRVPPPG